MPLFHFRDAHLLLSDRLRRATSGCIATVPARAITCSKRGPTRRRPRITHCPNFDPSHANNCFWASSLVCEPIKPMSQRSRHRSANMGHLRYNQVGVCERRTQFPTEDRPRPASVTTGRLATKLNARLPGPGENAGECSGLRTIPKWLSPCCATCLLHPPEVRRRMAL